VAFCPIGHLLLTAGTDGTVRLFDPKAGTVIREWRAATGPLRSAGFVGHAQNIVTVGPGGAVVVWDPRTGKKVGGIRTPAGRILDLAIGANGTSVGFAGPGKTVSVGSAQSGLEYTWPHGGLETLSVAFSPDRKHVVTAAFETSAKVWDLENRKMVLDLHGRAERINWAGYSPDGNRIATASTDDGTVRLWDAHTGMEMLALTGQTRHMPSSEELRNPLGNTPVAFSPDGSCLAPDASVTAPHDTLRAHSPQT
jgi:WD40 repeat protein